MINVIIMMESLGIDVACIPYAFRIKKQTSLWFGTMTGSGIIIIQSG